MKTVRISHQKATGICRKFLGGIKVPAKGESYLLPTGAKLCNSGEVYLVSGYHHDGSDVDEIVNYHA